MHISFPTFYRNIAVVNNLDIKKISDDEKDELKKLFKVVPLIMFKNQSIRPKDHYDLCKIFDTEHNNTIVHPYKDAEFKEAPQIALRGNGHIRNLYGIKNLTLKASDQFKYNFIWHQDLVGKGTFLPPVVSSIYTLVPPPSGGSTLFASLENGYDSIDYRLKKEIQYYNVIYSNSFTKSLGTRFDYTGYNKIVDPKLEKNELNTYVREPLVVYSDELCNKKSLMLNPFRFDKIDKLSYDDSYELYREIMHKNILRRDNMIEVFWEQNDLLIFNNRKLIHTSTPSVEYERYNRLFMLCFLGTNAPINAVIKNI